MSRIYNIPSILKYINVKLIQHKGESRIAVTFEKKQELIDRFKKLKGAKWNVTFKVWHLPDMAEYRQRFKLPAEKQLSNEAPQQIEKFVQFRFFCSSSLKRH